MKYRITFVTLINLVSGNIFVIKLKGVPKLMEWPIWKPCKASSRCFTKANFILRYPLEWSCWCVMHVIIDKFCNSNRLCDRSLTSKMTGWGAVGDRSDRSHTSKMTGWWPVGGRSVTGHILVKWPVSSCADHPLTIHFTIMWLVTDRLPTGHKPPPNRSFY